MISLVMQTWPANQWPADSVRFAMERAVESEMERLVRAGANPQAADIMTGIRKSWLSAMAPAGNS